MRTIPYGHQSISEGDIREVTKVLRSDRITQGPKIREFEDALCKYARAKYAVAVSNGTAALHIACLAAGVASGDEVITSPMSFVASANCVSYCGGKPVFADIQEDTANIDPQQIKRKVNTRTRAIIPVHFSGHPTDLEQIGGIAKKHRLLVIEDAAHALGAEYKGSRIGSCQYSDMTIFSFHPVKSITTGEGGAVLTNREDLYERLLVFRNHGITKDGSKFKVRDTRLTGNWYYEMQQLGYNYRVTDFQCALGICQLKKLDKFVERRRKIVEIYNSGLSGLGEIKLPVERHYVRSSWHLFPIRLRSAERRKAVFEKLRKAGIGVQVHYIPVHLQPYYRRRFGYKRGGYPVSERYYRRTITLPLYPEMRMTDIRYVIEILGNLLK